MKKIAYIAYIAALALAGCAPDSGEEQSRRNAEYQVEVDREIAAGRMVEREYYPQPDFSAERFYKVEDQFGCRWWMEAGSKFDDVFIVLRDDGTPDCDDPESAPAKTIGLFRP